MPSTAISRKPHEIYPERLQHKGWSNKNFSTGYPTESALVVTKAYLAKPAIQSVSSFSKRLGDANATKTRTHIVCGYSRAEYDTARSGIGNTRSAPPNGE